MREIQEYRKKLAADVAAASDAPLTSLADVSWALRRSTIRLRLQLQLEGYRISYRISLGKKWALKKSTEAVKRIKRIKERKTRQGS